MTVLFIVAVVSLLGVAASCDVSCLSCDKEVCVKCDVGFYPVGRSCGRCLDRCVECDVGYLCSKCQRRYFLDANKKCRDCPQNCSDCSLYGSRLYCSMCDDGFEAKNDKCEKKVDSVGSWVFLGVVFIVFICLGLVIVLIIVVWRNKKEDERERKRQGLTEEYEIRVNSYVDSSEGRRSVHFIDSFHDESCSNIRYNYDQPVSNRGDVVFTVNGHLAPPPRSFKAPRKRTSVSIGIMNENHQQIDKQNRTLMLRQEKPAGHKDQQPPPLVIIPHEYLISY